MYRCKLYPGDYRERQEQADADRCAAYVELLQISSGISDVGAGDPNNHRQPA